MIHHHIMSWDETINQAVALWHSFEHLAITHSPQ
jgi:hypothetical protein